MKKILSLVLIAALAMTMFTACGSKGVKTGLAVISSAGSSKDATDEKDGLAQVDSTAVAVLVDDKGVIKNIAIDVIQTKFNFSATGEITTDLAKRFDSKKALGDDYNMRAASPIGKEWDEQAEALEQYVIGKTVAEVKGIALDGGYPTDEDLTSSVTMNISNIIAAIEKAVNNAKDLGANPDDKLGLGITSVSGKSTKNASEEGDGNVQAYSHYSAVSLDKNGKITSSIIDASQTNVAFNIEGKLTSELTGDFKTKLELGNDYNMKGASPIGKEWFEQSEAFSNYMKGKTISDITGLALENNVATDKDLVSSVTITINDFITTVERAGAVAK
ncbi:MAG: hypothetical protein GX271_04930 [Clostridiales bacterium]|nr:hypothetical protein [Clostridiales bacterium]